MVQLKVTLKLMHVLKSMLKMVQLKFKPKMVQIRIQARDGAYLNASSR